jgi:hypothetical protein
MNLYGLHHRHHNILKVLKVLNMRISEEFNYRIKWLSIYTTTYVSLRLMNILYI